MTAMWGGLFTGRRRRVRNGILFGLLFITFIIWGFLDTKLSPEGKWVGEMDITDYDPREYGDTPGPHKHAAMYVDVKVGDQIFDRSMKRYMGSGELFIAGETKPVSMRLHVQLVSDVNGFGNAACLIWTSRGIFYNGPYCHYEDGSITITDDNISGTKFKSVFHRGDMTTYRALLSKLQAEAAHEPISNPQPIHTYKNEE